MIPRSWSSVSTASSSKRVRTGRCSCRRSRSSRVGDVGRLLDRLAGKAGLPADGWKTARLSVFRAEVFGESRR